MKELEQIKGKIKEVNQIRSAIKKKISELPDNPSIKRMSPNCFTISSSEIFGNPKNSRSCMSVFYHDYKAQYKMVAKAIASCRTERINSTLKGIIDNGVRKESGSYSRFNPIVIDHLKTLIKGS